MFKFLFKRKRDNNDPIIFSGPAARILRADAENLGIPLEVIMQRYLEVGRDAIRLKNEHPDGKLVFESKAIRKQIHVP